MNNRFKKTKNSKNKLVIFDFDGVLVDTEYTTFSFYKEILPSYGIRLKEEDFRYKIGRKSIDFFRDVLKDKFNEELVHKLILIKREAFIKDVKKYLRPLVGAFNLLKACQQAGLHMAIGSQNERPLIDAALDIFNIKKYFEFITALQDLKEKKPNPEVFFLVSNKIGIPPAESVVIEDAPVGILAAKAGGFKSIGITNSFSRKDLRDADLIIDSMTELNPRFLENFTGK